MTDMVTMATCECRESVVVAASIISTSRRKFKRKRDDVKALHATMKELRGIDPLDYLAR